MFQSTWSHSSHHDSLLQTIDDPVVLVGHSYGGAVITEAAGLNNVKALVYVAASALDKGESAATVLPADKYPGSLLTPDKLVVRKYPDSSAQGGTNAGHSRRSDIKPLTGDTS
ncbi:alpha/beta hydrolase [Streptomyces sp. NBC_01340]